MSNPLSRKCADCVYVYVTEGCSLQRCARNPPTEDYYAFDQHKNFCGEWSDASGSTFLNNSTLPKSPFPDTSDRYTIAYLRDELPTRYADERVSPNVLHSDPPRYTIEKIGDDA